jgi:CheY-like chemotaxis protein
MPLSLSDPAPADVLKPNDILLVEDEADLRDVLREFLQHTGYTVHAVAHGRAAIQHLAKNAPRLVVTDIFMPEADGFELLSELRRSHPQIPVVAMSGSMLGDTKLYLNTARYLGAQSTLAKPFALREFLAAVQAAIGGPR